MNEIQEKADIFADIWYKYTQIKDVLLKAKLPDNRLPDYNDCQLQAVEAHINRMRSGKHWMEHFISTHIAAWQKVRRENPEQYWDDVINLGLGENFTEVRKLNELSKNIRKEWIHQHNFLLSRPKQKEEPK